MEKSSLKVVNIDFRTHKNIVFWLLECDSDLKIRFLPALKSHLIYDLSGQIELEPFIVNVAEKFEDLNIPNQSKIFGISVFNPDFKDLNKHNKDRSIFLNATWVYYLYFRLLDKLNQEPADSKAIFDFVIESYFKFFEKENISKQEQSKIYSDRHKRRIFKLDFDLSSSKAESIAKFQQNLELILIQNQIVYSQDFYFDQSHFIKNFKKYTGLKPSEFIENWICPFGTIQK